MELYRKRELTLAGKTGGGEETSTHFGDRGSRGVMDKRPLAGDLEADKLGISGSTDFGI